MSRLLHCIPTARGDMTTKAAEALGHVAAFCAVNDIRWTCDRPEGCFIEDARNRAVETAILRSHDLLLFQDPDVAFGPEALPQMLQRMRAEKAAAVAAIVRRRGRALRLNANHARPGCLHEHAEVGTALMLLDVKQVKNVVAPWFKREVNMTGTRTTVGEDIAFCRKLKKAGLKVLADFTFSTEHRDEQWLSTASLITKLDTTRYALTKTPTVSGNDRSTATSA